MMWAVIEHMATVVECWIWTNFLCRFLKCKSDIPVGWIYGILFAVNFAVTTIFNSLMTFEGFLGIIRVMANFGLACVLLKGSTFEKFFAALIMDIATLLLHYTSLSILSRLFGVSMTEFVTEHGILRLTALFVNLFLFLLITRMMLRSRNHERYVFSKSEWFTLAAVFLITMLIEVYIFKLSLVSEISVQSPETIAVGIGLCAVNVLVYGIMIQMSRKNQENIALLMDKMQREVSESQLADLEKQQEDMKQIRHDMKNHMQYISGLIQKQSNDEAQKYIENIIKSKLNFGTANVKTGSRVVDIITNSKLSVCNANQIRTAVSISHFDLDMEDVDICIVLGNLLDNAIEACCKVENERFLFLEMVQNKGYVHLTLKNSIEASVLETNPKLHSTKDENKLHGLGLKSVRSVIKKYDGMMNVYEEHGMFVIEVWMPALKIAQNPKDWK